MTRFILTLVAIVVMVAGVWPESLWAHVIAVPLSLVIALMWRNTPPRHAKWMWVVIAVLNTGSAYYEWRAAERRAEVERLCHVLENLEQSRVRCHPERVMS